MQAAKQKLFTRNFNLVVIGQIISLFGSAILRFAMDLYVLDVTGRADIFALVVALSAVPGILFTPIGGAIADRFNRRNLMVIFDFSSSAIVLLLLVLLGAGQLPVVGIGVILAALSLISCMYQPAVVASIPVLVGESHLATANGLVNGVMALSGLLGPVLGGVFYGLFGLQTLIVISCVAFALSAVMEIFIHIPFVKQARTGPMVPSILADMKSGFQYVAKTKPLIMKIILFATALNMFLVPFFIVGMPYVLRVTMQSNESMYGFGMGFVQLCMILGALLAGPLTKKMSLQTLHRSIYASAALLLPIALAITPFALGLGYWPSFLAFVLFSGGISLLSTLLSVFAITLVQTETPNQILGKVMAIVMALASCAAPIGQALYGLAFEWFNTAVYIPVLLGTLFTLGIAAVGKRAFQGKQTATVHKAEEYPAA